MNYLSKRIKLTVTIPKAEVEVADYVQFYSNGGVAAASVDFNTAFAPRQTSRLSGVNRVFTYSFTVNSPATWKFGYKVFDTFGNAGTTSGEFTADVSTLVPAKAPQLHFVSYTTGTKIMKLGI